MNVCKLHGILISKEKPLLVSKSCRYACSGREFLVEAPITHAGCCTTVASFDDISIKRNCV